jgi:hypothetical protein
MNHCAWPLNVFSHRWKLKKKKKKKLRKGKADLKVEEGLLRLGGGAWGKRRGRRQEKGGWTNHA